VLSEAGRTPLWATKFASCLSRRNRAQSPYGLGLLASRSTADPTTKRGPGRESRAPRRRHIDLWYLHTRPGRRPIEETIGAMAAASTWETCATLDSPNVTGRSGTLRPRPQSSDRRSAVPSTPLWRREAETSLLPTLRELGIALVAWSPLGAGFLTGTVAPWTRTTSGSTTHAMPARTCPRERGSLLRPAGCSSPGSCRSTTGAARPGVAASSRPGCDSIPGHAKAARIDENAKSAADSSRLPNNCVASMPLARPVSPKARPSL